MGDYFPGVLKEKVLLLFLPKYGGGGCPLPPPLPRLRRPWKLYGLCYGFTKSKNTIGMYKVCWQVDTNPNWVRENLLQGSIHILRKHITFLGLWTHHHHTHVSLFSVLDCPWLFYPLPPTSVYVIYERSPRKSGLTSVKNLYALEPLKIKSFVSWKALKDWATFISFKKQ